MTVVGLIWAQSTSGVIGRGGGIPWRVPEDQARFKALTMGHTVVMGRRTWESLPAKVRPLPIAASNAVAFNTAMPGTVARRRASALLRAYAANSFEPLRAHIVDQTADTWTERMVAVHDPHGFEMLRKLPTSLGNCNTTFQQHSTQRIYQRRSLANERVTHTVQGLYVELRLTLQLDKPHRRSSCRLRNRLRIAFVVLL